MFRKMPVILLALIVSIVLLDAWIPLPLKSFLYALSLSIKSIMIFLLPALIFMLLFKTLSQISKGATKLIVLILVTVCLSNFISTLLSYCVGSRIYQLDLSLSLAQNQAGLLQPLWSFSLPQWITNDVALFAGILSGIFLPLWQPTLTKQISLYFEKGIHLLLKFFILVIPFFIGGFIIKFVQDKVFQNLIHHYLWIFLFIAVSQFTYVFFLYLVANRFHFSSFIKSIQNMLPAAIAGFSSMSSAAAMPLTLMGTEKNTHKPTLSRLLIPTTVNIHLIGDCFAIPIFAFAVLKSFGIAEPSFSTYLLFSLYFIMAKFSVAAVPGGGILVMLPVLENHLGFDAAMASLIFALYVLMDPVTTCANVLGNGGFALILSKFMGKKNL